MVFAKPKELVLLKRRDKRYKRLRRRTEHYHNYLTDLAYVEYYENRKD
jgi:hypothetical protein